MQVNEEQKEETQVTEEFFIDLNEKRRVIKIPDSGLTVPGKIMSDKRLSGNEKVLMSLIIWLKEQDMDVPTNEELSENVGISPRAIVRALNNLEQCGYLKRQRSVSRPRKLVL